MFSPGTLPCRVDDIGVLVFHQLVGLHVGHGVAQGLFLLAYAHGRHHHVAQRLGVFGKGDVDVFLCSYLHYAFLVTYARYLQHGAV